MPNYETWEGVPPMHSSKPLDPEEIEVHQRHLTQQLYHYNVLREPAHISPDRFKYSVVEEVVDDMMHARHQLTLAVWREKKGEPLTYTSPATWWDAWKAEVWFRWFPDSKLLSRPLMRVTEVDIFAQYPDYVPVQQAGGFATVHETRTKYHE